MPSTVLIVGAGFSGSVLAANLLRHAHSTPIDIVLAERGMQLGRGVAYAAREYPFLLNVPAARLSADSKDPLQFLRFAQSRMAAVGGEDFLPRSLYGEYLEDMLLQAQKAAPAHVRLIKVFAEVQVIREVEAAKRLAIQFADGETISADWVVLAIGNPPAALPPWSIAIAAHEGFRSDPWNLPKLRASQSALIVGSGLTMADAVAALSHDMNHAPTIHAISRHGLLPRPQTVFRAGSVRGNGEQLLDCAHSLRRLLAASRAMVREVEEMGGDWREALAYLRYHAPALWRRLPELERRRFLRHLQTHWSVYRHRLPPQLNTRIIDLERSGRLQINAGRIQNVVAVDAQFRVSWRQRGAEPIRTLMVDLIVIAIGPDYAISRCADPLLKALLSLGLISADALNLGLRTAPYGACVDAQGRISQRLFYLGPMLRAEHWEATGANELRDHAEQLAAHLLSRID
jgi:uncharacterized NAD(P)/FAD-binding protein YdhS